MNNLLPSKCPSQDPQDLIARPNDKPPQAEPKWKSTVHAIRRTRGLNQQPPIQQMPVTESANLMSSGSCSRLQTQAARPD